MITIRSLSLILVVFLVLSSALLVYFHLSTEKPMNFQFYNSVPIGFYRKEFHMNYTQISNSFNTLPARGTYMIHVTTKNAGNVLIVIKTATTELKGSASEINGSTVTIMNRVVNVVVANQTGGEVDVEFIPKREVSSIILPLLALSALGGVVAYALRVLGFE